MKLAKIPLIGLLVLTFCGSFYSCGVDRWEEYKSETALDSWIDSLMRQNYLWYEEMPSSSKLNLFIPPKEFLSKVISSTQDKGYSFADSVCDVPLPSYGFDYALVRSVDNDTAYNALITYIVPDSPADKAGLKRGEWIMKVDHRFISSKYEKELLQGVSSLTLSIGTYQEFKPEVPQEQKTYKVVLDREGVVMEEANRTVEDKPIHQKKVLTLANGTKVGYLMYNSFTAGTATNPEGYNNELRQAFRFFDEQQVKGLILDLRYNKGGSIACAQLLATLLVPKSYLNTPMAHLKYNNKNEEKNQTVMFDEKLLGEGVNLNLGTIIVITSNLTAGAPEMVMHCINEKTPQLIAIGGTTKGQNVATQRFVNPLYRWAINPVVCTIYNSKEETQNGAFEPTYPLSETSDYLRYKPFGDPEEILLNTAIGVLEGTYPPKTPKARPVQPKREILKEVHCSTSRRYSTSGLRL